MSGTYTQKERYIEFLVELVEHDSVHAFEVVLEDFIGLMNESSDPYRHANRNVPTHFTRVESVYGPLIKAVISHGNAKFLALLLNHSELRSAFKTCNAILAVCRHNDDHKAVEMLATYYNSLHQHTPWDRAREELVVRKLYDEDDTKRVDPLFSGLSELAMVVAAKSNNYHTMRMIAVLMHRNGTRIDTAELRFRYDQEEDDARASDTTAAARCRAFMSFFLTHCVDRDGLVLAHVPLLATVVQQQVPTAPGSTPLQPVQHNNSVPFRFSASSAAATTTTTTPDAPGTNPQ